MGQCLKAQPDQPTTHYVFADRAMLDIANRANWQRVLSAERPDLVINAAAYTNVEAAEDHPDEASRINVDAAATAAQCCAEAGVHFVHTSTDYVFDGRATKPYTEANATHPLSVYGTTKRDGELAVQAAHPEAIIVRLSWLYSPYGKNFMRTMLQRFREGLPTRVVNDQVASPTCGLTFADDLQLLIRAAQNNPTLYGKVYHYAQSGEASWYDFACEIARLSQSAVVPTAVSSKEFPTKAVRPRYSKLDTTRFCAAIGREITDWQSALQNCLNRMK